MRSFILLLTFLSVSAFAGDFGTQREAESMLKVTVASLKTDRAKTLTLITSKDSKFNERDLYPVVYDMSGNCLAHGQNPKQVGKNLMELMDANGVTFIKDRVEKAKHASKFTQEYGFTDPITKKSLQKQAFCEKVGDDIACVGVYKR